LPGSVRDYHAIISHDNQRRLVIAITVVIVIAVIFGNESDSAEDFAGFGGTDRDDNSEAAIAVIVAVAGWQFRGAAAHDGRIE
jgi:hypothetical protein